MGVVIAVLIIAVIAVIIATNVDSGRSLDSSAFKQYTLNYGYAEKRNNEEGETEVVVEGHGAEQYVRLDINGNGTYGENEEERVPASEVIVHVDIDGYLLTGRAANGSA